MSPRWDGRTGRTRKDSSTQLLICASLSFAINHMDAIVIFGIDHLTLLIKKTDYEGSMRRRRRKKGKQQQAELSCLLPSCPAAAFLPTRPAHSLVYNNRRQLHQVSLGRRGRWVGLVPLPSFLPSPLELPCCRRWNPTFVHIFFFCPTF